MAKRVTIEDEGELRGFSRTEKGELKSEEFRNKIFYLDACVLEYTVEKNPSVIEGLLENGNFRISRVAFNELKDWKKPGFFHPHKKNVWVRVQRVLNRIEREWPQNIENVTPGALYKDLTLLEPLLSKTITYELFMKNVEKIWNVLIYEDINEVRFSQGFSSNIKREFKKVWEKELKRHSSRFEIVTDELPSDFEDIIAENRLTTLIRIFKFIKRLVEKEGYGPERIKRNLEEKFKNKLENDKLILEHYLLAKHPKHLPTHDKDIYELAVLHRSMIIAA